MKIILLNPNTTKEMTDRMVMVGTVVAAPDTTLVPLTAPRGVPYIASRAEAQIAGATVLELLAEHAGPVDAAIIGAFGDPGLIAARELFDIPIVGMAEAAMLTACLFGERFAIVTFSRTLVRWYADSVAQTGLCGRCAGIVIPDAPFSSVDKVQADMRDALVAAANDVVTNRNADVVILGGAPLAGLARDIADSIPAPVIDPTQAAVLQAEAAVRLRARPKAHANRPAGKVSVGLPEGLAAAIANGGHNRNGMPDD